MQKDSGQESPESNQPNGAGRAARPTDTKEREGGCASPIEPGLHQTEASLLNWAHNSPELAKAWLATKLGRYQARGFALTWLSYASYYMTRKPLGVVKPRVHDVLGLSWMKLGWLESIYLASYAAGQFINGILGDRLGSRKLLAIGMLGSALCALLYGSSSSFLFFAVFIALNGFFQSSGWPGNIKAMAPWFGLTNRGTVMGFWGTCYQVGSIAATAIAGFILVRWGWRTAWFVPAVWVAMVAILLFVFLVDHPRQVGLEAPGDEPDKKKSNKSLPTPASETKDESGLSPGDYFRLFNLGAAYFSLKLIRYTLWFWLPTFFTKAMGYAEDTSAYLSTAFDVGGIVGAIVIGYLSDRYVAGRRVILAAPMVFGIAVALLLFQLTSSWGMWAQALTLAMVGFMLFGPDSLLSGAAAQDLGGPKAAAKAAGIINGLGSLGPILQGPMTAYLSKKYGWNQVFYVLIGLGLLATVVLIPVFVLDLRKKPEKA